ncbi:NlpC/P60 family protein [Niabella ginsengisoli]|uniref:NlpC/P60 family protein n=1 Tax=Niabella ginsengisoli TaxID=522298 RepID=UPI0021D45797|nr:NlpC/P60 family protein [Niabella ginsengisoli]
MLVKPIFFSLIILLSAGCTALKKTPQKDYSQFIYDNGNTPDVAVVNDITKSPDEMVVQEKSNTPEKTVSAKDETRLKNKYATFLKTRPDKITDVNLYAFIDEWLYTPYLWAGTTKNGIDCSAFIQRLFSDVYKIRIPRHPFSNFSHKM